MIHSSNLISLQSLILGSYSDKNLLHKNLYEQAMRVAGSNLISKFEKWGRHIRLFVVMVIKEYNFKLQFCFHVYTLFFKLLGYDLLNCLDITT